MEQDEIISSIESNDASNILYALVDLDEQFDKMELTPAFVDLVFQYLIPFLVHNHYKIRTHSLSIMHKILESHGEDVTDADLTLPNIAASLYSVNKRISSESFEILKILMNLTSPKQFWPVLKALIVDTRSTDIRVHVLELLEPFAEEIPIGPILQLLDDPKIAIREEAQKILDKVDPKRLATVFHSVSVSFETAKALKKKLGPLIQETQDEFSELESLNDSQPSTSQLRYISTTTKKLQKYQGKTQVEQKRASTTKKYKGNRNSQASYSEIHQRVLQKKKKQEDPFMDCYKSPPRLSRKSNNSYASKSRSSMRSSTAKNSYASQLISQKDKYYDESDIPEPTIKKNTKSVTIVKSDSENEDSFYNPPQEESQDSQDESSYVQILKQEKQEAPLNTIRNMENSPIKAPPPKSQIEKKPIGRMPSPKIKKLPFKPRDLSHTTWLERLTYLEMLEDSFSKTPKLADDPEDIIDCVISTLTPPHRKVTAAVPSILASIIYRYPEVLQTRIQPLARAMLETAQLTEAAQDIIDALATEADPTELIGAMVRASEDFGLPIDPAMSAIIEKPHKLAYNVVGRLLTLCIQQRCGFVLQRVCDRYVPEVRRYAVRQSIETKRILAPFVRRALVQGQPAVDLKGLPQPQLMQIVHEEMRKGRRCDFGRLSSALALLEFEKEEHRQRMFEIFLRFAGKLPANVVDAHCDDIDRCCTIQFDAAGLFEYVTDPSRVRECLPGLSRCVWSCPPSLLEGSDTRLPSLYEIFRKASGAERVDLVRVFLAIETVTGKSVADLPEVSPGHKLVITQIAGQLAD